MSELDTILYRRHALTIGRFRCRPNHPGFEDSGPIERHIFVFPHSSVFITHAGRRPVVADRNAVMFYNRNQVYRRGKISPRGDHSYWFSVRPQAATETIARWDPAVADRPDRPFGFTHGPCDPRDYLHQGLLVDYLLREVDPDPLWVEETALRILHSAVAAAYRARGRLPPRRVSASTKQAHADLTQAVKALLACRFNEPLTLEQIAREVASSPFHLSRVFRRHSGFTLHAYLNQLRLRVALDRLGESGLELTDLALDLGYSSHSHFTCAFRRLFGVAPSVLRRSPSAFSRRTLSRRLATETPL
jgi:AraC-like DNA-binding protein